jgi:hypothetical protein
MAATVPNYKVTVANATHSILTVRTTGRTQQVEHLQQQQQWTHSGNLFGERQTDTVVNKAVRHTDANVVDSSLENSTKTQKDNSTVNNRTVNNSSQVAGKRASSSNEAETSRINDSRTHKRLQGGIDAGAGASGSAPVIAKLVGAALDITVSGGGGAGGSTSSSNAVKGGASAGKEDRDVSWSNDVVYNNKFNDSDGVRRSGAIQQGGTGRTTADWKDLNQFQDRLCNKGDVV